MYRIWVEEVLGFKLRGDLLTIDPAVPDDWPGFEMAYRYGSTVYEISVRRGEGEKAAASTIQLVDDGGSHEIAVWLPAKPVETLEAPASDAALVA
jgi:cyclic beta-1,2-glucan synthetase